MLLRRYMLLLRRMTLSEKAFVLWVKWKNRLDNNEVRRAVGWKPSGIEYRIMLEGKAASLDEKLPFIWQDLIEDVDLAWRRVHQWHPHHMRAVEIYFKRGKSYRAVRTEMGISQHKSRIYVDDGIKYLIGGLAAIAGFENGIVEKG